MNGSVLSIDTTSPTEPADVPDRAAVERCVYEHGHHPDSYLVTEPDYKHFWDDQQTGCIGYIQDGRYLHVVGGLIAAPERQEELLAQFTQFNDDNRYLASFFSIEEEQLPLFRKYGYQATKFGENTHIPLADHNWKGKPYAWIRRQVSFVSRQGIIAREINLEDLSQTERTETFARLQEINDEHLSERVMKHEIGLLEGKLYPDYFYRRRLFVACEEANPDNWQAFVACTPMRGGRGWATEMYRSRNESARGVIPFLIASLIDQMQEEGVEEVSLCMIPAINCKDPHPGDSKMARFLFGFWEKRLNFLFNSRGLYHFKSRFRPNFTSVFLCVRPRITSGSTFSFVRSVGVFKMNWMNYGRHLLSRKEKSSNAND
ncbi:MAG: hypothetical protein CMJ47_07300 [Planctomyces sp.]|nr:hypothetical protein [Planctomyces sp.]